MYLSNGSAISLLAYTGQVLERPGLFVPSHIGSNLELNHHGQVVFTADDFSGQSGIFRVDSGGVLTIALEGDTVPGTANSPFVDFFGSGPPFALNDSAFRSGEPSGLDEDGDVTFFFSLADDREGIARVEVCEVQDQLALSNASVAGAETHEACNGIDVSDVTVQAGGHRHLPVEIVD